MSHAAMTADVVTTRKLDELFHAHRRMLWGLSYRMTGCAADADDIVQETFARATAELLHLSEENIRITHLRARRAMQDYDRNRCQPTSALQEHTRNALAQFIRCLLTQDVDGATALLAALVRTTTDGGSEYMALHRPLVGRKPVLTLHLHVAQRRGPGARIEFRLINELPAVVIEYASAIKRQAPRAVLRCELDADGHIRELHTILASQKLTAVRF